MFNFSVLKNLGTEKSVIEIVNRVNLHSLSLFGKLLITEV